MRRHMAFAAIPACALLVLSPFNARADEIKVPAPAGKASAVAAQVGTILSISKTAAVAEEAKPTAEASVIRLFGQTLLGLGGEQEGVGDKHGALIDTGESNPIRIEVAPWSAKVEDVAPETRHSNAKAALAKANVANIVKAAVLHSESDATWTGMKSTGSAFSNGVELSVTEAIKIVLLHSEVTSEGKGNSYLIGLNDTQIGTDEQLGDSPLCALNLPSVLSLSCLKVKGGDAVVEPGTPREAASQVAQVDPEASALSIIDPVGAFTTAGSSGGGTAPVVTLPAGQVPAPAAPAAEDARTPDAVAPAAPALPRTGAAFAGLLVSGLVALLGGALLRFTARRRVTV